MRKLISLKPILEPFSVFLGIIASSMLIPMMLAFVSNDYKDAYSFGISAIVGIFISINLYLTNTDHKEQLTIQHAFILTASSWILLPAFACLPMIFSDLNLRFTDAYFEAVSGLATCGATVIDTLNHAPKGLLLWRAMLSWLGGIGIIVLGISILPMLQIGGMQLFRTEVTDSREKIIPRATQLARGIISIYSVATMLCFIALYISGLTIFDAFCHALTAISTGGFGTYDNSISAFRSLAVEVILMITMIIGSIPFVLMIQVANGNFMPIFRDQQVRLFLFIIFLAVLFVTFSLYHAGHFGFWQALRYTGFNFVSSITTTGYTLGEIHSMGALFMYFMIFLPYLGGCTGSTAGGIKIFRIQILFQSIVNSVNRLIHPHGVFKSKYNNRIVTDQDTNSVTIFCVIYISMFVILVGVLSFDGINFVDSAQAVSYALADAGLPINGYSSYQFLPDLSKWTLIVAMLMGRLEFFTIFVLFIPATWRKY